MSRVALTVQNVVLTGLVPVLTAGDDTNNHIFSNDGRAFLYVVNGATDVVVTVSPGLVRSGLNLEDLVVTVAANTERMIGPFPVADFNQAGTSNVHVDIDDDTNVTLAAIRLP